MNASWSKMTGICVSLLMVAASSMAADGADLLSPTQRVLFLGDSITHAGGYITQLEAHLRVVHPKQVPNLINLGLPSETCSGLSEPDHPFPRPTVQERLDRALSLTKPDVVFVCYGMNDGIYHPFSEERFAAYQAGINRIIQKVQAAGAKLVLMTPPAFDPLPLRNKGNLLPAGAEKYAYFAIYENYDDVLKRYADWIMSQRDRVDLVIDLHSPVTRYVSDKRQTDDQFTMSPDGVHVNDEGHRVLATSIFAALGQTPTTVEPELIKLVAQRQRVLHDAWLSHVGHLRPGMTAGLPINEAQAAALRIDQQIRELP